MYGDPDTISVQHFEGLVGGFGLADEREPAKVCMCANAHVALPFLRWVVDSAHVGHGVRCYGIEVVFGEIESECKDVEHAFAEFEHGFVVAIDCGAPEEG